MMRRTPFDEMEQMFDQMRRSTWSGIGGFERGAGPFGSFDTNLSLEPTDEGYVVLADLPGFEREEIDLRFDGGVLTIDATHEVDSEVDGTYSARSRRVHEQVAVPAEVVVDEIEATYSNGVLEVVLPTVETAEDDDSHRIDIE